MKKLLLSLSAAIACMGMSAAVPVLTEQYTGSFNVTQEKPDYSNPSAYDADGNLIIAGAFNDTFGSLEAIGTSAYIVKYDKQNAQLWSVGIIGSASVTSIDTDSEGNIYVAGNLADVVEFGTTSGATIEKTGLMDWGEYITSRNVGYIAKYDANGKLMAVESFMPKVLPSLESALASNPEAMYFGGGDIKCWIKKIQVAGNKVYAYATVMGEVDIDGVKFEGTYINMEGFFQDINTETVFSLNTTDLKGCSKIANIAVSGPLSGYDSPKIHGAMFTVDNGTAYVSFVADGIGEVVYTCGESTKKLELEGTEQDYVFFTSAVNTVLKQKTPTSSSPANVVADMFVNNGVLYAVATAVETIPAIAISENAEKTDGVSDIFVASFNASDLGHKNTIVYKNAEGADLGDTKPNYEIVASTAMIDGAIYIVSEVYNYNQKFLNFGKSLWFDGSAFSDAPVNATGIAVGKGVVALVTSDAEKVDYKTYTFNPTQSGISGIEADFDENAPVEYYNLQGIRVANPENGLYIRRQGNKVEKVVVK